MSSVAISEEIRRFILAKVPSVPFWEAILLLRSRPDVWLPAELAARLYVPEATVCDLARDLAAAGFAAADGDGVRYAPQAGLAPMVDELSALYARHVVQITRLIHSCADPRAQDFANAFLFRRGE